MTIDLFLIQGKKSLISSLNHNHKMTERICGHSEKKEGFNVILNNSSRYIWIQLVTFYIFTTHFACY